MDREEVLRRFAGLTVWSRGDQRAPHKPLLVLYALGCWSRGVSEIPFSSANEDLSRLLKEFGPSRKATHPEYPFVRLEADGIWTVVADGSLRRANGGDPRKSDLFSQHARGQFTTEVQAALQRDPSLVGDIARSILQSHFPDSIHQDILDAVGLSLSDTGAVGGRRDPGFRKLILTAYEYRCAVCGYQVLLSGSPVALDAAHIKWHQAAGPDVVSNGLALCVLHHKLFDLGAYTISTDCSVLVSIEASGAFGFSESLFSLHGMPIRKAVQVEARPSPGFIEWHQQQVFRSPSRPLR